MTYTISLKPPLEFRYDGSFFQNCKVTVFESGGERTFPSEYERDLHVRVFGTVLEPSISPIVYKIYQPSDRRYNAINRDWKLTELIDKLDKIHEFGPIDEKVVEQHKSFAIERDRPEDRLVKINWQGVCLKEWPFEPLYRLSSFETFGPAIKALKDIQVYLQEQGG